MALPVGGRQLVAGAKWPIINLDLLAGPFVSDEKRPLASSVGEAAEEEVGPGRLGSRPPEERPPGDSSFLGPLLGRHVSANREPDARAG